MSENTITKELLQSYVDLGWVIVPVGKTDDGKYKKPLKNWRNFNHIGEIVKPTTDELWQDCKINFRGKVYGIGAITGSHSNLFVIDLDSYKEDTNFEEIKKKLQSIKTPVAKTGGGGYHVYFQFTDEIKTQANLIKGLDTRGQGGFVVLPPSMHDSGNKYEWIRNPFDTPVAVLPQDLLDILPKKKETNLVTPQQTFQLFDFNKNYFQGERDQTMFSSALSILKMLPKHRWLNAGLPLYIAWAKEHIVDNNDNFVSDENLIKKFQHSMNYAEQDEVAFSNLIDLVSNEEFIEKLFNPDRFGMKTGYEIFDKATGGVLSSNLTLISAQTSIGKSLVFMNLLNNMSKERKVAYFDLENGSLETVERVVRIRYGFDKKFFTDPLNKQKIKSLINQGFENYNYLSVEHKIRDPQILLDKIKEFADKGTEVFVIDPLQKINGGDDIKLAGDIVGKLSDISKQYNVAILLCHHVKKSVNSGGRYISDVNEVKETKFLDPDIEDIKGGSIIPDTAENVWIITRNILGETIMDKSKMFLKVSKCRTNGSATGKYKFFLDLNTLRLYERPEQLSFYHQAGSFYNA